MNILFQKVLYKRMIKFQKCFINGITAYENGSAILEALEYIWGSDTVKDLYFSSDSNTLLLKTFLDKGYTYEEYKAFVENTNSFMSVYEEANKSNYVKVVDFIVDMYKKEKNSNWEEDENFKIMVAIMLNKVSYYGNDKNSKYYDELKEQINLEKLIKNIYASIDDYFSRTTSLNYFIKEDELYFNNECYYYPNGVGEDSIMGVLGFKYDFRNNVVKNIKFNTI